AVAACGARRKGAGLPQLSFQAGYIRTNHVVPFGLVGGRLLYPDVPDNLRSRIALQWPIYTGGRVSALTRAAESETRAIAQDRDALRADLKLDISRAYWAV